VDLTAVIMKATVFWDVMLYSRLTNILEDHAAASIFQLESHTSALKMIAAVGSSKMLVTIYQTAHHDIPEDINLHNHCHENLRYLHGSCSQ
jgi:hypothetical protein